MNGKLPQDSPESQLRNLNDLSKYSLLAIIQAQDKNVIGQVGHDVYLLDTLIVFSTLLVRLSEEAEVSTQENIKLQKKVVRLTWWLMWMTLALFLLGIIQVATPFFKR